MAQRFVRYPSRVAIYYLYMFFSKKHQKKIQIIWGILVILIIISMILLYSPIFAIK